MPRHGCHKKKKTVTDIIVEVTQRFSEFQTATSEIKRVAHASDPALLQAALDAFISFMDPDYQFYRIDTSNMSFDFPTLADLRAAYALFGFIYNGFSTHFATDVIVNPVAGTHGKQVRLSSGGGEYGSIYTDFTTSPPSIPAEYTTLSDFELLWVYKHGNWYINQYSERGNRVFRFFPPTGPYTLVYARTFPGATPEPTDPPSADGAKDLKVIIPEPLKKYLKK
jgi:hypothetical protein